MLTNVSHPGGCRARLILDVNQGAVCSRIPELRWLVQTRLDLPLFECFVAVLATGSATTD